MNEKIDILDVDESSFNQEIIEASENKLVLVDFWAPWCGPCKQLTPTLEKIVGKTNGKVRLAKINIDENQQVAGQLRIQSIPAVFAFKNKQIVDGFQGVIPEKKIFEFIEKALGEKLEEDFTDFFNTIKTNIKDKNYALAKESLEEFIANKPKELKAISILSQGASLRFLLTRLYDWFNTPKEAILNKKNPLEYLNKLRFFRDNNFDNELLEGD